MADIFLSYARADLDHAKDLAGALEQAGWTVWWDRHIPVGKAFYEIIDHELSIAKCVIVLWTKQATASDWVVPEASEARKRGVLVPATFEVDVRVPLEFRMLQNANLADWSKDLPKHTGFEDLVSAVSRFAPRPPQMKSGAPTRSAQAEPEPAAKARQEKLALEQAEAKRASAPKALADRALVEEAKRDWLAREQAAVEQAPTQKVQIEREVADLSNLRILRNWYPIFVFFGSIVTYLIIVRVAYLLGWLDLFSGLGLVVRVPVFIFTWLIFHMIVSRFLPDRWQ